MTEPTAEQTEEALHFMRFAFDRAADAIFWADPEKWFVYVNDAACEHLGYSREELLCMRVPQISANHDADQFSARWEILRRTHHVQYESLHRHKSGRLVPIEISLNLLEYKGRNFTCGIVRDITKRKLAEESQIQSARRLRLLKEIAVAANEAANPEEVLRTTIERICRYKGWPIGHVYLPDEINPSKLVSGKLWHMEDAKRFSVFREVAEQTPFALGVGMPGRVLESRKPVWIVDVTKDAKFQRSDIAKDLNIRAAFAFPIIEMNKVVAVLEFFSDQPEWPDEELLEATTQIGAQIGIVIGRKQGEQYLRAAHDQLLQLNAQLETAKGAADAANRSKSDFLANMSHEIRTPMTAILGYAEIVLGNVTESDNVEGLKTIQRNGEYLLAIINDILDLSKIEAGKLIAECIECSPCTTLSDVASLMRVRAKEKGLLLEVEYDGPIPQRIQSDPTRLHQILVNLTGNAIKFCKAGKIRLVARLLDADTDAPSMQFDVVDTGIGISAEQISKLFQPFVQADVSTTREFGGTGLGLTISKQLAKLLGGDIRVHSVPGEGSTFSVTVLTGTLEGVELADNPVEAEVGTRQVANSAAGDVRLDCRVLLAEDGLDNQRLIAFILEKAGADVTIAENGQIALDLALAARDDENPFDVILMDMQMPVLDGYAATSKLREADYTRPIIALTAHAMSGDRAKCLAAGCDDYTTKPINRKKLLCLLAQYTSQQTPAGATNVED